VKGNASALGLVSLASVAHRVESLLDLARSGRRTVGNNEVDVVLRAVDVLTLMIRDVGARLAGQPATPLEDAAASLMLQLDRLLSDPNDAPAAGGAAPPAASEAQAHADGAQTSIKVDTRKLDSLVDMVGELIIVQSLIHEDPALVHLIDGQLARNLGQLKRITAELHRNSRALRMVPIRQAFQKVARVVRDLSRKADKTVDLELTGEETELDRKMVEEITDPLMHMARNSLDHGIEAAAARLENGKPARAKLTLSAAHQGGQIVIQIADDGAGLPTDKILAQARARGLVNTDVLPAADDIHRLIFEPGFSTADKVTEVSGRGVGMDVVRRNVIELGGDIAIETRRGQGARIQLRLPLTLAIIDGQLIRLGVHTYVVPLLSIVESV
jgi:two-component system chemotaxis sensor kinase CheA